MGLGVGHRWRKGSWLKEDVWQWKCARCGCLTIAKGGAPKREGLQHLLEPSALGWRPDTQPSCDLLVVHKVMRD